MESLVDHSPGTKTRLTDGELGEILNRHQSLKGFLPSDIIMEEITTENPNLLMYMSRNQSVEQYQAKRRNGKSDGATSSHNQASYKSQLLSPSADNDDNSLAEFSDSIRFREKRRHISTSLATLVMRSDKRFKVVQDGAIPALLKLCTVPDEVVQRCCASCFAYLSTEKELRSLLLEQGVVTTITSLVVAEHTSNNSTSVRSSSIKALCNLAAMPGLEAKILREGGQGAINLIALVPELLTYTLRVMLNLSSVKDRYHKVEDVTDAMMHILEAVHDTEMTEEQEHLILSAIANLSHLRGNQLRLVEEGVMTVISTYIASPRDKTRELVAHIVSNLTTDSRTRTKLVDQGIINRLLSMASDHVGEVRSSALSAFHNLARDKICREKVVSTGAVVVVVKVSTEPDISEALCEKATYILKVLCTDSTMSQYLIRDGVVKALVTLARYPSAHIQLACIEALCSLFACSTHLATLLHLGSVGVLVNLCSNRLSSAVGDWCSYALYQLSEADEEVVPASVLRGGVLPSVLRLCDRDSSDLTRVFCASTLAHLTANPHIDTSAAIPTLVHMLSTECSENIKVDSAAALYNLAVSNESCKEMLSAGALLPIISLTKSDHLDTKIRCAAILSRLTGYKEYHDLMTKDDLKRLLELSTIDLMETQRRVVITLSNLSENETIRSMLLEIPETCDAMKLLISRPDDMIRSGVSSILCNLSAEGSEMEIVSAGVVPTLLVTALLSSDKMACKIVCTKALINLMAEPTCWESMVKDGLIWALGNLAQLGDPELTELTAKSLANLSRHFPREFLKSAVATHVVMDCLVSADTQILRYGSRMLLNMLQATTVADEDFRIQSVERMAIVKNPDEEVSRLTILCLCLSSQSEACRDVIVRCGILHAIDAYTIFRDPRLSIAYLTMFGNIAQNPTMRVRLLDHSSVDKFNEMSKTDEDAIHTALAKVMYYVSCSKENIAFFSGTGRIDDNGRNYSVLTIVNRVLDRAERASESKEIFLYICAFIYNLTSQGDCSNVFLAHGILPLLFRTWERAKLSHDTTRLVVMSAVNLACGKVNTARLADDGAVKLIAHVVTCRKLEGKMGKFYLEDEDLYAWSSAMRNLANVIANHEILAKEDCIHCLVTVAQECYAALHPEGLSDGPPPAVRDVMNGIIRNCTAALRSMTYHSGMQEKLSSTGAIDIIINASKKDLDEQNLEIGSNLLHEIESESWKNGTRGIIKDGRTVIAPELRLCEEYLGAGTAVELNFVTIVEPMAKMVVSVHLGENKIDKGEEAESRNMEATVAMLPRSENEDEVEYFEPLPKQDVPVQELEHDIHIIVRAREELPYAMDNIGATVSLEESKGMDSVVGRVDSATDISVLKQQIIHQSEVKRSDETSDGDIKLPPLQPPLSPLPTLLGSRAPASDSEAVQDGRSMPDIQSPGANAMATRTSTTSPLSRHPTAETAKKSPSAVRHSKFKKLVGMIAKSRLTKGAYIDDVARTWNEVSKF